ncbi:hypothetical protein CDAR_264531 [Caerostris darwini]|uniref:Uncharacterized protein n=1 Tax=Caerostris darwini TaxID=1538125 RepID=A0AAV4NKW6_9ARAC|nr:hypothetical protein CDAR_264531 [Caerostris darwini]
MKNTIPLVPFTFLFKQACDLCRFPDLTKQFMTLIYLACFNKPDLATRLQWCEIWDANRAPGDLQIIPALSYKQKRKLKLERPCRYRSHISPPVARHYERSRRETHLLGMFGIAVLFDSWHDTRAWLIGLRHVSLRL